MERDKEAYWLVQLSQTFDFAPETFVLAISIMDRVSTLVKVGTYLNRLVLGCANPACMSVLHEISSFSNKCD